MANGTVLVQTHRLSLSIPFVGTLKIKAWIGFVTFLLGYFDVVIIPPCNPSNKRKLKKLKIFRLRTIGLKVSCD